MPLPLILLLSLSTVFSTAADMRFTRLDGEEWDSIGVSADVSSG